MFSSTVVRGYVLAPIAAILLVAGLILMYAPTAQAASAADTPAGQEIVSALPAAQEGEGETLGPNAWRARLLPACGAILLVVVVDALIITGILRKRAREARMPSGPRRPLSRNLPPPAQR